MLSLWSLVIQVVLESLPISSSGHLALAEQLLGLAPLLASYMYALHIPTALVLAVYWRRSWWPLVRHPYRFRFIIFRLLLFGFVAELATVLCYAFIKALNFSSLWLPLGFFLTSLLLLLSRGNAPKRFPVLWVQGRVPGACRRIACVFFLLGMAQGLAAFPGLSRLGCTYVVGLLCGLRPMRSFAASCLIQWPLIVGAGLLGCWQVAGDPQQLVQLLAVYGGWLLVAVLGGAMMVAYMALWVVEWLMRTDRLWLVGLYLAVIALLSTVLIFC